MEEKINIAEILKNKPKGTKLWTDMFGEVKLAGVDNVLNSFKVEHHYDIHPWFDKDGKMYKEGTLCIYPSKLMRDWRKLAWKKGDVLTSKDNDTHVIFEKFEDDSYTRFKGKQYLWKRFDEEDYSKEESQMLTSLFEKANDDEAQSYINTIEERLDGKLNLETLEIEKIQPEFKDGDVFFVRCEDDSFIEIFNYSKKNGDLYDHASLNTVTQVLDISGRYRIYKDEIVEIRLATDSEKQELFDALAKKNKAWDAEEKQIVDLKPKWTPKPFDKIVAFEELGRKEWVCDMFSHYSKDGKGREVIVGIGGLAYSKAVPFNEKTAKLIGTTKEWKG